MEMIEELIQKANDLFEMAEEDSEESLGDSILTFQAGIKELMKAFLYLHDLNAIGDFKRYYEACKQIEPDFNSIENEINLLLENVENLDSEDVIDAANEIWDFIIDLISEVE